jgi:hypothetical protein
MRGKIIIDTKIRSKSLAAVTASCGALGLAAWSCWRPFPLLITGWFILI